MMDNSNCGTIKTTDSRPITGAVEVQNEEDYGRT